MSKNPKNSNFPKKFSTKFMFSRKLKKNKFG